VHELLVHRIKVAIIARGVAVVGVAPDMNASKCAMKEVAGELADAWAWGEPRS